jgi:hypothetical protein
MRGHGSLKLPGVPASTATPDNDVTKTPSVPLVRNKATPESVVTTPSLKKEHGKLEGGCQSW